MCISAKRIAILPEKSVYNSHCEIKNPLYTVYVQEKSEPRRICKEAVRNICLCGNISRMTGGSEEILYCRVPGNYFMSD